VTRLSFSRQEAITDVLAYLVFAVALLFFGFPLLWVLSLSIRTAQDVVRSVERRRPRATPENAIQLAQIREGIRSVITSRQ
jgi:ABC-type glycerol-3-phosphate transport system permease component